LPQSSGGLRSTSLFDVRVPYVETIDVAAELMRLMKEHERLTRDIASKERQLGDDTFRSRAPEKLLVDCRVRWRSGESKFRRSQQEYESWNQGNER